MIREKIIISFLGIVVSALVIEAFPAIIQSFTNSNGNHSDIVSLNNNDYKKTMVSDTNAIPLSINSWGKDIFYDRTNIYNSWFQLTGITRFENGYKAIVNGQIVHELNRVRGFTVKTITKSKVVLVRDQYRVILKMGK
tara:strand:+ start:2672 stop:3085 length:414 start_codon:yes stop_codon:yes gene_type:complete